MKKKIALFILLFTLILNCNSQNGTKETLKPFLKELKAPDFSIISKQEFYLQGQYFDKKTNKPLPWEGIIVIKNTKKIIEMQNGNFEIHFPDTSKIIFPLEIEFQCKGFKNEIIYFEKKEDLLKSENNIDIYFEVYDIEFGLVLKAKTSVWYKMKRFFKKIFKKKK